MHRPALLGTTAVASLAIALLAAAVAPTAAEAATTYTRVSLTASQQVPGAPVAVTAKVKASTATTVLGYAVAVRTATGQTVNDSFASAANARLSTTGTSLTGTAALPAGQYKMVTYLHLSNGSWPEVGAWVPFTVTAAPNTTTSNTGGAGHPAGSWSKVWADEFDGTALSKKWVALDGYRTNNVTTRASNVRVTRGQLVLTRSDAGTGAEVDSATYDGASEGYELQVGDYVEASVNFPGNGTELFNWPAWWTSGPGWPAAGEHDIAEVLGGKLTVNYHSPSGSHNTGAPVGYVGGASHTYGVHRKAASADVYWDGQLVRSYATDDNGKGQALLINVGSGSGPDVYGAAGAMKVDWVRAWRPTSA